MDLRDLETLDPLYIASKHSEDAIIPTTLRFLNRIDPIGRAAIMYAALLKSTIHMYQYLQYYGIP